MIGQVRGLHGRAMMPPVIGIGNARRGGIAQRQAFHATGCQEAETPAPRWRSPRPTQRIGGLDGRRRNAVRAAFATSVRLRAPPPATIPALRHFGQQRHDPGNGPAAVSAVKVAAPSAGPILPSSELGRNRCDRAISAAVLAKNGSCSARSIQSGSGRPCAANRPSQSNGWFRVRYMKSSSSALPGPVSQAIKVSAPSI